MQKIKIENTFEQDWIRMFAHLANLFFEQCEIITDDEEEAITGDFILQNLKQKLSGKAFLIMEGKNMSLLFQKLEEDGDEKRKTVN